MCNHYFSSLFLISVIKNHFFLSPKAQFCFSLCELQSYIVVEVVNVPDDSRTLIIVLSITIGAVICAVFLSITFFVFKIRTAKEHEAEAEVQKRQQELR